jgi:FkbM family methyltransferase
MHLTVRQRASWLAHLHKAATKQHHRPLRALLAPYIPSDAVVVDIGAHAGQFSKLFAGLAPHGRVYAFEPSSYARSILVPALKWNRIGNVKVLPVGLSDQPGEMMLHTPIKRSGSLGFGAAHLGADAEPGAQQDEHVALTTLDTFAKEQELERLDFIKADVEGWELRALTGGAETLMTFHPALFLEVDHRWLARAGDRPEDLFDWLGAMGYRAMMAPEMRPTPLWNGDGDYLFTAGENL